MNATAPVPGTFVYTPAAGSIPATGSDILSVTFTPTDTVNYTTATATVSLSVGQTTPTITWATPAAITYGAVLSGTQLSATASVPGTFAYTPTAGTTPITGSDTLSVIFTPTDTVNYSTATTTVSLTVNKATPTITWATPAAVTSGIALSSTHLNATASVPGTFIYTPAAGAVPSIGSEILSVDFTPTDAANYNAATATVTLIVNAVVQTTPTITWATPSAITYGAKLTSLQLNATASVAGTFVYIPAAGSTPPAGSDTLSLTFTPTDAVHYTTAAASVTLTVNRATPTITWATPVAILSGAALSDTQLNASASVPGTFVYSPAAGTVPAAGSDPLSVIFTPTDISNYTTATASVTLIVTATTGPITPVITWETPAAITVGTALSGTQLNATASVDGTFIYSPAAGTIPIIGLDTLTVIFTPTDAVNYTSASAAVILTVGDFFSMDFSGSPGQTVTRGATVIYDFTVTPKGADRLPGIVTFSTTGLPSGATAVFSPSSLPANSLATPVTLTVETDGLLAKNPPSSAIQGQTVLGILLLPLLGLVSRRKRIRKFPQLVAIALLGMLSFGSMMSLTGCGAASSVGPQPKTYTIVVTATCGKLQHSTTVTITVLAQGIRQSGSVLKTQPTMSAKLGTIPSIVRGDAVGKSPILEASLMH